MGKKMNINNLKQKFIKYFEDKGYEVTFEELEGNSFTYTLGTNFIINSGIECDTFETLKDALEQEIEMLEMAIIEEKRDEDYEEYMEYKVYIEIKEFFEKWLERLNG